MILKKKYIDYYHVISLKTKEDLKKITDEIFYIPFWVNGDIWFEIKDKLALRNKYKIPKNSFVIGSFQRDTEGSDAKVQNLLKVPIDLQK